MGTVTIDDHVTRPVAEAALEALDRFGPDGCTIAAVAGRVGCRQSDVEAAAADDAALVDLAIDQVYALIDLRPLGDPWPERLRVYARSFRSALLAHPRAAIVLATRPIVSVASMHVAERALDELTQVGFEPEEAGRILLVIVSFVTGHALTEIGAHVPDIGGHDPEAVDAFRRGLPSEQLPLSAQVVPNVDRDQEFELGLGLIVGGLERRLLHAAP